MPDLRTRFQGAERIPAPDLWEEIISREPRQRREPSPLRKLVIVAFALAISLGAIVFVVQSFAGREPEPESKPSLLHPARRRVRLPSSPAGSTSEN